MYMATTIRVGGWDQRLLRHRASELTSPHAFVSHCVPISCSRLLLCAYALGAT